MIRAAIAGMLGPAVRVDAQTLSELIAEAKKESEMSFVAGANTFGGRQAFAELQAAFNQEFGLSRALDPRVTHQKRGNRHRRPARLEHGLARHLLLLRFVCT
jgi:hypothetical protein